MRIVAANKLPLIVSSIKIDATPEKLPVTMWAIRIQNIDPMKAGEISQAAVKATYSDFKTTFLTSELTLTSSDNAVASIDETSGLITALRPGDTIITAKFGTLQDQYHLVVKDSLPPTTDLTTEGTLLSDRTFLGEAIVRLAATDDYAGVEKTEYSLDQGNTWKPYTKPFVLNQDGSLEVQFRSSDKAGNIEPVQTHIVKVTSATIANLRERVKNATVGQKGTMQSLMSHIDNAESDFQKSAQFLQQGQADQATHFEAKGYDSLQEVIKKAANDSDEQINPADRAEILAFVQYMIDNKTVKARSL